MTLKQRLPDIIHTRRITLRRPVAADIADLVALANNPNVIEHTATLPFPYRQEDGEAFIAGLDLPDTPRSYAMADTADRLMGIILIKCSPVPELGYWLGEPHWGQGFVTEAVIGLMDGVEALAPQISARVLTANAASIRVLEKAGFTITEHTTSVIDRHRGKPIVIMHRRTK